MKSSEVTAPLMSLVYTWAPSRSTPATTSSTKKGLYAFIPLYTMFAMSRALSLTERG